MMAPALVAARRLVGAALLVSSALLASPVAAAREPVGEVNGGITPDARWQLEYDALGQLAATIDPEGHRRGYVFGRLGELLRYTDPKGGAWSYTYDADGKPLSETDPLGHAIGYGYDKVGNLLAATDERSKVYRYGYDANNRQTQRTDPLEAPMRGEQTRKLDLSRPLRDTGGTIIKTVPQCSLSKVLFTVRPDIAAGFRY